MKKILLLTMAFTAISFSRYAQENKFTAEVNVGLPLGD